MAKYTLSGFHVFPIKQSVLLGRTLTAAYIGCILAALLSDVPLWARLALLLLIPSHHLYAQHQLKQRPLALQYSGGRWWMKIPSTEALQQFKICPGTRTPSYGVHLEYILPEVKQRGCVFLGRDTMSNEHYRRLCRMIRLS